MMTPLASSPSSLAISVLPLMRSRIASLLGRPTGSARHQGRSSASSFAAHELMRHGDPPRERLSGQLYVRLVANVTDHGFANPSGVATHCVGTMCLVQTHYTRVG